MDNYGFPYLCPMLDYLIVGLGLAGVSFCEELEANSKTYMVLSDNSQNASIVAAGLYNPVILKRFTLAWEADKQMPLIAPFYARLEKKLGVALNHKVAVFRRFASVGEQNDWFQAADNPELQPFLANKINQNDNPYLDIPFGLGEVKGTGRIATGSLIEKYSAYLKNKGRYIEDTFDGTALQIEKNAVSLNGIKAKRIVFAEGFGLARNPFFNYLPLTGTKGELLQIHAPKIQSRHIIKSAVFLVPLGEDCYSVGATYKWKDKTNTPTSGARSELLKKLQTFVKADFTVLGQRAGIRPTVTDRRPLVGQHPKYKNLYVFNGMGSRGVMIAPYASRRLYELIEHGKPLKQEMDIARFSAKYQGA